MTVERDESTTPAREPAPGPVRPGPGDPAGPPNGVRTMSVVRWVLVVVAAIVAGVSIAGAVGGRVRGDREASSTATLFTCPMHPSITQDHPGECPICSMTLVAKPRALVQPPTKTDPRTRVPGLSAIELSAERIQLMGMRTAVATRTRLAGELRATGAVAATEPGLAQVTVRFGGWIEKLLVSSTGAHVKRGQILATVVSPDVLRAEQELLVTHAWGGERETKGVDADARRRLDLLAIAPRDIDEMLRAGKAPDTVAIRSPVDGYVIGKTAVVGLAIQPGAVLYQIADLSTVWVTADIPELDLSRIRVGQDARFVPSSSPAESRTGKVAFVSPIVDPQSRTLTVRIEFKNRFDRSGPKLRPGTYGDVYLALPTTVGLMVPSEAVVDTGEMKTLFVARPGGHFEPRLVTTGVRQKDTVEILSGVSEGETVVTTGNFLLDSESRLHPAVIDQSMGRSMGQSTDRPAITPPR